MSKIQDNTELKKSVVQNASLCLSYLFLSYFDKQVHKKLEKKNEAKKKKKKKNKLKPLNFAESNAHRKTNARSSFET